MRSAGHRFLMAFDFGTGGGRCCLVRCDGCEQHAETYEWTFDAPVDAQPGGLCFDPELFWGTLATLARTILGRTGVPATKVAAVTATGIREGFVLLDGHGREIFAVPNRDTRARAEAREISETLGAAMNAASGHWPCPIMLPARYLWLRRHAPAIAEQARTLLMISDWLLYRLCGERVCEATNGAETCLLHIAGPRWDEHLIDACAIPLSLFPPVVRAGLRVGSLTPEAAEATGLLPGTPVVAGGADTQSALLSMGAQHPGHTGVISGTSTLVQLVLDAPTIDPEGRTWSGPHLIPGRWVLESSAGLTGSVLRWFRDIFCKEEIARATTGSVDVFALLCELAARSPIGAAGVTASLGSRIMDARAIGLPRDAFQGFAIAHPWAILNDLDSKSHFLRAILESIAFAVRGNLEQLAAILGAPPGEVRVCGGLSRSDLWMQMLADCLNRRIERAESREASALGAAMCAGVGIGEYTDFAQAAQVLGPKRTLFQPTRERRADVEEAYRRWHALETTPGAVRTEVARR